MKFRTLSLFFAGIAATAQTARQGVAPETVVADLGDGKKITAGEMTRFVDAMTGQLAGVFERDPKEFTRQYALLSHLAKLAEQEKLDKNPPNSERLAYARMNVLMQGLLEIKSNPQVNEDQIKGFYNRHLGDYTQVNVKVLYLPFVTAEQKAASEKAGKAAMIESEAKAKIEDLRKQALGGADFVALIKANSQDTASRDKDGDYPPLKKSDQIPDAIKGSIFNLKAGEYSEAVRQPNGFYLFRVEKVDVQPYDTVKTQAYTGLKEELFRAWFETVRKDVYDKVKFENEAFFTPTPKAVGPGQAPLPASPKPSAPKP